MEWISIPCVAVSPEEFVGMLAICVTVSKISEEGIDIEGYLGRYESILPVAKIRDLYFPPRKQTAPLAVTVQTGEGERVVTFHRERLCYNLRAIELTKTHIRIQHMGHRNEGPKKAVKARRSRFPIDEVADPIECSCQSVRSCSVGLVADCVAICCCPCAIVDVLVLALVKVPWMVGRRCMGSLQKKGRKKGGRKRIGVESLEAADGRRNLVGAGVTEEETKLPRAAEVGDASSEAERVWMELYQMGQLGFGRVSFSGIHHVVGI
ncbi:hypothetical protein ACLOJK_032495 [Asimina triloba]